VQQEASSWLAGLSAEQFPAPEPATLANQLKTELNQRLGGLGLRVTRCQLQLDAAA
jgi:hypothetical protein